MEWTTILLVLVLAVFMLGCCGSIFRRRKKDTSKDKDHDDTPQRVSLKTRKGEIFYGRFNANEYDEWRNDVVCDIICSSRCLVSYSNRCSNKNSTALQKREVISSALKNSRLRIDNYARHH